LDHDVPAGRTVGLILRERPWSIGAMYGLLATERPMLLIAPLQPDAAIADDVRTLALAALIADRTDWARQGLVEAANGAETLGLELTADAEVPVQVVAGREAVAGSNCYELPAGTAATLLTSGTTGAPKRIPVTYADLDARFVNR